MRAIFIVLSILLTGCGFNTKPTPVAPVVLTEACEPVEIPVPVHREPPSELLQPEPIATPKVVSPSEGAYGLSRDGLELIIEGFRKLPNTISALACLECNRGVAT